jgi:hypothetical protein
VNSNVLEQLKLKFELLNSKFELKKEEDLVQHVPYYASSIVARVLYYASSCKAKIETVM